MAVLQRIVVCVFLWWFACATVSSAAGLAARQRQRQARHLVYPESASKVQYDKFGLDQFILGFGVPVDLPHQAVTIGYVLKSNFLTPYNASQYTRPLEAFASRKARGLRGPRLTGNGNDPSGPETPAKEPLASRWDLYDVLQVAVEHLGGGQGGQGVQGGRQCLLRAVCESAASSIQHDGLLGELLHVILTPSATEEPVRRHPDNEFHAAERAGRAARGDQRQAARSCHALFPACDTGALDLFTRMLPF